ncbi:hypothetical protein V6N13_053432 [Hibiscus sabdariffa]|uniref:MADS-box domain-containing protein n=1 Tax=Hibiscus sabdariffa TaxID=183260 RepID=A0ABR2T7L0_9ROSI
MVGLVLKGKRRYKMSTTLGKSARQDTDTKRSDFLRKANELCALFAFEVALIIFSPNSKTLCSDHFGVDANIDSCDNLGKLIIKLESERKGHQLKDRPIEELNLEELLVVDVEMTEFIEKLKNFRWERLAKDATS